MITTKNNINTITIRDTLASIHCLAVAVDAPLCLVLPDCAH